MLTHMCIAPTCLPPCVCQGDVQCHDFGLCQEGRDGHRLRGEGEKRTKRNAQVHHITDASVCLSVCLWHLQVFDYMRDAGLRPSQVTYGSLLHACVSRGEVERVGKATPQPTAHTSIHPSNECLFVCLCQAASLAQFMKDHDVSIQSNLTRPLMQSVTPTTHTISGLSPTHRPLSLSLSACVCLSVYLSV